MIKNDRGIDYQISEAMFNSILAGRTDGQKKLNPYQYAMSYLNDTAGLRGTIKHLSIV